LTQVERHFLFHRHCGEGRKPARRESDGFRNPSALSGLTPGMTRGKRIIAGFRGVVDEADCLPLY